MRFVDDDGNEVWDMAELEPYRHFVKFGGSRYPIVRVEYAFSEIKIQWDVSSNG